MKVSLLKATAFLSAAVFAASVGTANAAAVDSDNGKCRGTIGKNVTKLASTVSKAFDGCVKSAVKAGTGSCTTTAGADTKNKVTGTKQKFSDAVGGIKTKCDATVHAVTLGEHQICGTPNGSTITDFPGVSACLNDIVDKNVERLRNALLAPDYAAALADGTKLSGKCINAIGKNATKYLSTIMKEQSKAIKASDKIGGDSNYSNPGDPGGKIGGAAVKLDAGLDKACGTMTSDQWAIVRTCDDDLAGAKACIKAKVQAIAEGLIASAYDQPGSCPDSVKVQIHHDAAGGARLSATELDVGFTGLGHNAGVIDGFQGAVKLSCGAAPNDCTSCTVESDCSEGNCRCTNDTTGLLVTGGTEAARTCQNPFTQDTCGAGNSCIPYFGPPLALSAGGTPTCVLNKIGSELVGNANIATGESDTAVNNVALVYNGIAQDRPCPTCESGLCNGGPRNGLSCTVDGTSEIFGDVSYDCMPNELANISGSGLKITLNLTDGDAPLAAALPCDVPGPSCACSICSIPGNANAKDPSNTACNSNAECAAIVGGGSVCMTTDAHGSGTSRVPNVCADGTCESIGGGEGVCSGENQLFCDGFVKANGEGALTCADDAACATYGIPGAGTCTLAQEVKCFTYPIQATGTPGSEGAVLVSTFCSPPTTNTGVNGAAGTPGPARVKLDFEFFGRCADGSPWGPGGANCQ